MLDMAAHGRVGVAIKIDDRGRIVVDEVFPGLPAAQAGVEVGDQLVTVNETPLAGMNLIEIRELLAIPPGGAVDLAGVRDGQAFRVSLKAMR
jgi:C-terminal processing protease CtpA/Prc